MNQIKCVSQEQIDEIKKVLSEAHKLIASLDSIASDFQASMVLAETKEDRESLLKSVNLLEIETDVHRAIALAVERISVICIDLHEKNLDDHHVYTEVINKLKPHIRTLITIADVYETTEKGAKYSTGIIKLFKTSGIIAAAVAVTKLLEQAPLS